MSQSRVGSDALWGLVLAAGDGKRLENFIQQTLGHKIPKQFVNFVGRRSMLEHTFERVEKLIVANKILTIVSKHHIKHAEVRRQLLSYSSRNVIVQPANKETGPGVLLPLLHIYERTPDAIVSLFPSDHFILEEDRFMAHVELAAQAVARDPSRIVLLAVEAHEPEVEYGYVIPCQDADHFDLCGVRKVARFIEKPTAFVARALVKAGGLWNTMVMVFQVRRLWQLVEKINPAMHRRFYRILETIGTSAESDTVDAVYRDLEPVNFSKGLLEKISVIFPEAVTVLPVRQVLWSDWGSSQRIMQIRQRLGLTPPRTVRSRKQAHGALALRQELAH